MGNLFELVKSKPYALRGIIVFRIERGRASYALHIGLLDVLDRLGLRGLHTKWAAKFAKESLWVPYSFLAASLAILVLLMPLLLLLVVVIGILCVVAIVLITLLVAFVYITCPVWVPCCVLFVSIQWWLHFRKVEVGISGKPLNQTFKMNEAESRFDFIDRVYPWRQNE